MNNIYKAFNVNNETELDKLIESLDLDDEQHIELYTSLNESMSVDGIRYIVESLTKKFDNGSYEKIQEQYKKKNSRKKKETVYDHSWYETDDGDYPKRTKEGIICETFGEFPNLDLLEESQLEWRKYCGFLNINNYDILPLPEGKHHREFMPEDSYKDGWFRFGVQEYHNDIIGYINGDTRENVLKVMKHLDNTYLKEVPISYYMVSYKENGREIRMSIDKNGRQIYEHKEDWPCSCENIERMLKKEGIICEYVTDKDGLVHGEVIIDIKDIVYDSDEDEYPDDLPNHFDNVKFEYKIDPEDAVEMKDEDSITFRDAIQEFIDYYIDSNVGTTFNTCRWKVIKNDFKSMESNEENNIKAPKTSGEEFDECLNEGKEDKEVPTEEDDSNPRIIGREKKDPKSNADPTLAKEIAQIESVVNNTNNPQVLKGLLASVEAKIPLAIDVEQMNQLGELKQKLETKINALSNTTITESIDYKNGEDVSKEFLHIFQSMSYKENESNEKRLERIFNTVDEYYHNYPLKNCDLIKTTYKKVDSLLDDIYYAIDIVVMDWAEERFDAYFDGEPEERDDMDQTDIYDYLRSHFSTQDLIYDIDHQTLSEIIRKIENKLSMAYGEYYSIKVELSEKPKFTGEEFNESVNYDPLFDEGDNVSFTWGGKEYTGRIIAIHRTNIELYDIVSYNNEKNRLETFVKVDPFENKMKRVQGDL